MVFLDQDHDLEIWERLEMNQGLPCGWCGWPTSLARAERFGCVSCSHTAERPRCVRGTRAAVRTI
ncbi:hypothetical protein VB716_13590 [Synechococcus sp. CCY9201]|jgi:hypothetical protein|uniref:hypothetical protein n=1 Tax=unclassified Synechococcus TaxID=2626047 RepID=UPI0018CF8708|nr:MULTISPECIES: hypothetical protein [unclassified Synechococcus]MEA5423153.1 hypothetical protein [Synechococcus sp. CCY9202]MEA5475251.1 hypothetical protein [Synechococcus sp. CCY9201]QPN58681.1 hypothetical protein H8F24_10795 [Synechococcus sp. CBW1002]CAK6699527.1 hypothetical protein IFHNHDMJ_02655 [Synechococcus sp. CBW1107]